MPETNNSSSHGSGVQTPIKNAENDIYRKIDHLNLPTSNYFGAGNNALRQQVIKAMRADRQDVGAISIKDNKNIAAGYTYLGQFLAHDITASRNLGLPNPSLNLLSLYGGGPSMNPFLYVHYDSDLDSPIMKPSHMKPGTNYTVFRHAKFRIRHVGGKQYDVFRDDNQLAVIADSRNDQNFLLNQIHCAFLRFHNAIAEWLHYSTRDKGFSGGNVLTGEALFAKTRKIVTWCYQRILVEEYLPMLMYDYKHIVEPNKPHSQLIEDLKGAKPGGNQTAFKLFDITKPPVLMPEFSLAAMRLGHTQVQDVYQLSWGGERRRIFEPNRQNTRQNSDLRGFKYTGFLNFEWDLFFDNQVNTAQSSSAIDHRIADSLYDLMFLPANRDDLPVINMDRSEFMPSGNAVANKLSKDKDLLVSSKVHDKLSALKAKVPQLDLDSLPLWLYILLEAELTQEGNSLGILGSHILAEQILWILHHDPNSYVSKPKLDDELNAFLTQIMTSPDIKMLDVIQFPERVAREIKNTDLLARNVRMP